MLRIKVKTSDFLRAIRIVENAIEDDKANGQNSGIYIQSVDGKLVFKGVGFNLFIKCECNASILEEGNVIIKYKLIEELLRKIEDEEVLIEETGSNIEIKSKGTNASYNLIKYNDPQEFSMINGSEYVVDKKIFTEGIENTSFAASTDVSKLTINCIKMDIENNLLKLVSTDSFRLIYREVELEKNESNENASISLPLKTAQNVLKVLKESKDDNLLLQTDGTKLLFKIDDIEIIAKVIELQFPDYDGILKSVKSDKIVKVNSEALKKKLDLVYLFVKDKKERKDVAEFIFNDKELDIIGFNDTAKVEQKISISKDTVENLKIYLNTKFILDYLNTIKKSTILEIKMSSEIAAILIKEEDINNNDIYLTMPLKI
ncbi:DNA polymerase III subunit beta [Oceanivirga miroungae]|uniref:DNA polymerase III subunit beta n=1 Tax=Oceanivirga miroungae TaxID=1130046 RepID=A0A6I8MDB7_9FUSO|nr:DNA polymerase III subunit beta [Oceanivirga miroungae]VWL85440.1 DNA polymerase III subunit beta [Oceanivirga miroungae]